MRKSGLAAIFDNSTRVLIVGTFPSQKSLAIGQYYANPRNYFWKIIGSVLGQKLTEMDYRQRTRTLLASGIGLWDAIESCEREGSMDHKIVAQRLNDIQNLASKCSNLRAVACNGRLAGKFLRDIPSLTLITLTSSSPANTSTLLAEKVNLWRSALSQFL